MASTNPIAERTLTVAERRKLVERHARPAPPIDTSRLPARRGPGGAPRGRALRSFLAALGGTTVTGGGGGASALTGLGKPETLPRRDPLLNLVHRITLGFEKGEYERAQALGYDAYLEEQLDHLAIDDSDLESRLFGYTTLDMSPKQLVDSYVDDQGVPYLELKEAWVLRAVHSKRHLYQRMCEFWRDHFHIDHRKGDLMWIWLGEDDRTVIRPHALGSFPDMLTASAFSPAMLYYLDNWLNVLGAPQENYSREVMELHTLGVQGGYSEVDVKQVAECFTGWTLNLDSTSQNYLRTLFDSTLHEPGPKQVLGQTIPGFPPRDNAQGVLDILAAHPSTAEFLARKLIRWFLTPEPPEDLVESVADTYLATNGDIKSMLRVILARRNMAKVSTSFRPKFKRPFHLLTSVLRTLQADVTDPFNPVVLLFLAGHPPFEKVTPDGFPDTVEAWGSSLLPRWEMANYIVNETIGGVSIPTQPLINKLGSIAAPGLAARIDEHLLGKTLTRSEVERLQAYIDARYTGPIPSVYLFETITLAMSLPGFQWY